MTKDTCAVQPYFRNLKYFDQNLYFGQMFLKFYFIDPRITFEGKNMNLLRGVLGKKYLLF